MTEAMKFSLVTRERDDLQFIAHSIMNFFVPLICLRFSDFKYMYKVTSTLLNGC